jgi:hypothetical protein
LISFYLQFYNGATFLEEVLVSQTTADKIVALSQRRTFSNIRVIAVYSESQKNNLVDFTYNIKNSTLTDVQITNLVNPTSAQDAVTRSYLESYNNIAISILSTPSGYSISGGTTTGIRKFVMKSGFNYVTHILGVGTVASNEGE